MKIGNIELSTPLIQAPMADFSTFAFRQMIRSFGGCGLMETEMVNARSFLQIQRLQKRPHPRLFGIPDEPGLVSVQLWDNQEESLAEVSNYMVSQWHVPIIDLNFCCPSPDVSTKSHCGAYLLDYPDRIESLVRATVEACSPAPVTVKLRLGTSRERITVNEVAAAVEQAGASAVTVHGRTRDQGYGGVADWDAIAEVKSVLKRIPLIGNGDIRTVDDAVHRLRNYPVDGIMIGRGCLGKPWLFSQIAAVLANRPIPPSPTPSQRATIIKEHFRQLLTYIHVRESILEMRKIGCRYVEEMPNAKFFRQKLGVIETSEEFEQAVDAFFEEMQLDGGA